MMLEIATGQHSKEAKMLTGIVLHILSTQEKSLAEI